MFIKRGLALVFILLILVLGFTTIKPILANSVFIFTKNLTLGSINNDVKELQKYLNANGFIVAKTGPGSKGKETTMFGRATKASLIKFQKANNIKPSVGYFGPLTRDYINKKNKLANNTNNNQNKNNQSNNTNNNVGGYTIGGTITGLGGPVTIQNNNNQETITINPGANSEFTFPTKLNTNTSYTVTIKQNYLGQSCYIKDNTGTITSFNITNIKIACGITLFFSPFSRVSSGTLAQFSVSYAAGANGSITGETSQSVTLNNNASSVTATPNTGYHFTTWSDGVLTASRTDNNIIANKSVTASFAIDTFTLTSTAGANGTITATATVNYGSDKTFTITPDEGYLISDVLVDDVSVGTDSTYTFSNVTSNHTIAATFIVESSYTLSVSAGANGTISPSSSIVSYGSNETFTITPNGELGDFYIYDILVDGVSVGTESTYTFTNVTSNHAILALFKPGTCGDESLQDGEECDEGDNNGGETCTYDCKLPSNCGEYVFYDWKYYSTVKVGEQCWFGENLSVGTMVNSGSTEPNCHDVSGNDSGFWSCQINNSSIEKYCYNNSDANCITDGGLYEWAEALQLPYDCNNAVSTNNGNSTYTLACPTSGSHTISEAQQGICPTGWHIPTFNEYQTLAQVSDLGCDLDCDSGECSCSTAGDKLKVTVEHTPIAWDGSDIYNYSALPSGGRYNDGSFSDRGGNAYFWSSVPYSDGSLYAWYVGLGTGDPTANSYGSTRAYGFSVRCIKDAAPQ